MKNTITVLLIIKKLIIQSTLITYFCLHLLQSHLDIRMSLKAFPISKSVGFVLTKRYCIYDELIAFCCQKRIDFMPECDDHGYYGVFRIHMFSLEDALHVIEFIRRRNLNAVFVNML